MVKKLLVCGLGIALTGCFQPMKPSVGHMQDQAPATPNATIPPPVQAVPVPPKPRPTVRAETYSVVVNNVNVRELLFALARDAKLNVDIHPGISGAVTLNAIDQTLPQLLTRIAKQVDMRYEISGPNLLVMPDSPYLRIYKIDYVNMERSTQGQVTVSAEIVGGQTGGGAGAAAGAAGGGAGQNTSRVAVQNRSANRFWDTLVKNVEEMLRETDKLLPGGAVAPAPAPAAGAPGQPGAGGASGGVSVAALGAGPNVTFREASSVIANPESGILNVRATLRQHEKLQEFLDQVLVNAKRQVLIEVTIVDVQLANAYQQGIDFNILRTGTAGISGGIVPQGTALTATPTGSYLTLAYTSASLLASLKLLETFGNVRVLSSPRISVVNNQTALLKVVENVVYFTISSQISQGTVNTGNLQSFTAVPQTVPVGVVLNLTPQISDADGVLLNVKPTISRISTFVLDPTPNLGSPNRIPQIVTREMESVIKLSSGQMAVMGGLIQDSLADQQDSIPFINRIPFVGDALSNRQIGNTKSELVIFLRPIVIRDPSLEGDYRGYRVFAPGEDFMSQPNPGKRPCDYRIDVGCPQ
ncbi:MAG TPA: secretin N-terminal domain-containing protein [Burkholderiales bacterium]|nr:secretin N-terminal domain-containing protein [Burkholderiales bacterium]